MGRDLCPTIQETVFWHTAPSVLNHIMSRHGTTTKNSPTGTGGEICVLITPYRFEALRQTICSITSLCAASLQGHCNDPKEHIWYSE